MRQFYLLLVTGFLALISFDAYTQNMEMSGGSGNSVYICANGKIYTFGNNIANATPKALGVLGRSSTNDYETTAGEVTYFTTNNISIMKVDAGSGSHTLALGCDGVVYSWGVNAYGQCGNGVASTVEGTPVQVKTGAQGDASGYLKNVVYISGGNDESYAILSTGELMTWGQNDKGQLGNGTTTNSVSPVYVLTSAGNRLKNVVKVEAGDENGYALTKDGYVYSWGAVTGTYGGTGMLGRNTANNAYAQLVTKTDGTPLTGIVDISAGDVHCLAIDKNGYVWSWGNNGWAGQCGTGEGGNVDYAKQVVGVNGVGFLKATKITAGRAHSVAVLTDGTVAGWGLNDSKQYGSISATRVPQLISGITGVRDVSDGDLWTFFVKTNGDIYVVGENSSGQLGLGNITSASNPTLFTPPCKLPDPCPTVNLGKDQKICPTSATTGTLSIGLTSGWVAPTNATTSYSYTWTVPSGITASSTTNQTATKAGQYVVEVKYTGTNRPLCTNSCPVAKDTVQITELSMPETDGVGTYCGDTITFKINNAPGIYALYKAETGGSPLVYTNTNSGTVASVKTLGSLGFTKTGTTYEAWINPVGDKTFQFGSIGANPPCTTTDKIAADMVQQQITAINDVFIESYTFRYETEYGGESKNYTWQAAIYQAVNNSNGLPIPGTQLFAGTAITVPGLGQTTAYGTVTVPLGYRLTAGSSYFIGLKQGPRQLFFFKCNVFPLKDNIDGNQAQMISTSTYGNPDASNPYGSFFNIKIATASDWNCGRKKITATEQCPCTKPTAFALSPAGPLNLCQGAAAVSIAAATAQTSTTAFEFAWYKGDPEAGGTKLSGYTTGSNLTYSYSYGSPGTYYLIARDKAMPTQSSCFAKQAIVINDRTLPTYTVTGGGSYCAGTTAPSVVYTISGTANFGFTWNNGSDHALTAQTSGTYTVTNPADGTYSLKLFNDAYCTGTPDATKAVTVTTKPVPTAVITTTDLEYCGATSDVNLDATAVTGATYAWKNGSTTASTANPYNAAPAGTYTVDVTLNGCTKTSSPVTVKGYTVPSYTISGGGTICEGSTVPGASVAITGGTSPWSFTYNDGSDHTVPVTSSPYAFTVPTAGGTNVTFTGKAISDAHCTGVANSSSATVVINPQPVVTFNDITGVCQNSGAVDLLQYVTPKTGTFSGTGVSGTNFTPSTVGTFNMTYTVTGSGCTTTVSKPIVVYSLPTASITTSTGSTQVCAGTAITLYGTPTGGSGTWKTHSWTGSTSLLDRIDVQNPQLQSSTADAYTLTYQVTDNRGCQGSSNIAVTVNAIPTVDITPQAPLCVDDNSVTLQATPTGGTFSGTGVSGTTFNPATATKGIHTITYEATVNGCKGTGSTSIVVNPLPTITFGAINDVCVYTAPFALTTASPAGGTYSGTGVSASQFSPAVAKAGIHTITYKYADPSTYCENSQTQTITVNAQPSLTFNLDAARCSDAGLLALNATPAGGTYAGFGVSGTQFDPTAVTAETPIDITYVYNDGNCSDTIEKSITVHFTLPPATTGASEVVQNVPPVLPVSATGINIVWYSDITATIQVGTGATYKNDANTAIGQYTYYATQTINSCESQPTAAVWEVSDCPNPKPTGVSKDVCFGGATPALTSSSTGDVIVWYNGTTEITRGSTSYTPSETAAGTYLYRTREYNTGLNCYSPYSDEIKLVINPLPVLTLSVPSPNICVYESPIAINVQPSGGNLTGDGVTGTSFNPATAGVGPHTLTYTYTDANTCTSDTTASITVRPRPTVNIVADSSICIDEPRTALTVSPSGGTISGDGFEAPNMFNPTIGAGAHVITYKYSDSYSCENSDAITMVVHAKPTPSITGLSKICISAEPVLFTATPTANTGQSSSWSGPGISNGTFDPAVAGTGTKTIKYAFEDEFGCNDTASHDIVVNSLPVITFNDPAPVCIDAGITNISATPAGGTFVGLGTVNSSIFGNTFNPETAGKGTHSLRYIYTDPVTNCTDSATKTITVNYTPVPTTHNNSANVQNVPPVLPVSADSVANATFTWYKQYNNGVLITKLWTGASYANQSDVAVQIYTYYVTQTVNGCESKPATATWEVSLCPNPKPVGSNVEVCDSLPIPSLSVSTTGDEIVWYSGVTEVSRGTTTYTPPTNGPGTYTFRTREYNKTLNCYSPYSDDISLVIHPKPVLSLAVPSDICIDALPDTLSSTTTGQGGTETYSITGNTGLSWPTFTPNLVSDGTYTITYNHVDDKGCDQTTSKNITVHYTTPPTVNDVTMVSYNIRPTISATATGLVSWYNDANTMTNVGTGSSLTHGKTASGDFPFWATQTINNCESQKAPMTLHIIDCGTPRPGISDSVLTICEYDAAPTFTATNLDAKVKVVRWKNETGSTIISTGTTFTPTFTSPGIYKYTVTQDTGCEGEPTPFRLIVNAKPVAAVSSVASICYDGGKVVITRSPAGGTIKVDGSQTDTLFDPVFYGKGQHTITYEVNEKSCLDTAQAIIFVQLTDPPVVSNKTVITYELAASPSNTALNSITATADAAASAVKWYDASGTFLGTGNPFAHHKQLAGQYTFKATQVVNGCESKTDDMILTLIDCGTPKPRVSDTLFTICKGDTIPPVTVYPINAPSGSAAIVNWYMGGGGGVISNATVFTPNIGNPGTYIYQVKQDTGCEGPETEVKYIINPLPTPAITVQSSICIDATPIQIGLNPTGGTLSGDGITSTTFYPTVATSGLHTLTYIYTDQNSCTSTATAIITVVKTEPPVVVNKRMSVKNINPQITAQGTGGTINWYDNTNLANLLYTGTPYTHGKTGVSVTPYWVTQFANGCESKPATMTLTIVDCGAPTPQTDKTPTIPICKNQPFETIAVVNTLNAGKTLQVHWYDSTGNLVNTGASFAPSTTAFGRYTYNASIADSNNYDCSDISVTWQRYETPVPTVNATAPICHSKQNPSFIASDISGIVKWYEDQTLTTLIKTGNTFTPTETAVGVYDYWLTNNDACESNPVLASFEIRELPNVPEPFGDTYTSCYESSTETMAVKPRSGGYFTWYKNDGEQVASSTAMYQPPVTQLEIEQYTTFKVTYFDGYCFSDTSTIMYFLKEKPAKPVFKTDTICLGQELPHLTIDQGTSITWLFTTLNLTYTGKNVVPKITTDGVFDYKVWDEKNNCTSDTAYSSIISSLTPSYKITGPDKVCEHSVKQIYSLHSKSAADTTGLPPNWSISGNRVNYQISEKTKYTIRAFDYIEQGLDTIYVTKTNKFGCTGKDSFIVRVVGRQVPDFSYDIPGAGTKVHYVNTSESLYITDGDYQELIPVNYWWNFGRTNDTMEFQSYNSYLKDSIFKKPYKYGYYDVRLVSDPIGYKCKDSATKIVFVDLQEGLFAPNAFSPTQSSSELNVFKIKGFNVAKYKVWIYDNWGNLLWFSDKLYNNQPAESWDGKYDGKLMKADSYIWKMEATFMDGTEWDGYKDSNGNYKKYGSVVLVR